MRKLLSALVFLLMISAPASSQQGEWANKLFPEGTVKDFGTVARGSVLTYKFKMKNIYAVPLQITRTNVSCGCVTVSPTVQWLQKQDPNKPGAEEGWIEVTMDARKFTGAKTVNVYISFWSSPESAPQYTSQATLKVSANSRGDVVLNPGEMNFGVVSKGQALTKSLDVEYAGSLDWQVTGTDTTGTPLEAKVKKKVGGLDQRGFNRVTYELSATLKPDAAPGTHRWTVYLNTNDPASPHLPVTVDATIEAPLAVVPGAVPFGTVKVGQTESKKVIIRAGKPFQVTAVEGMGDGVSVVLPGAANNPQVVTLTWKPTQTGELKKTLTFKTSLDIPATVSVDGTATAGE